LETWFKILLRLFILLFYLVLNLSIIALIIQPLKAFLLQVALPVTGSLFDRQKMVRAVAVNL